MAAFALRALICSIVVCTAWTVALKAAPNDPLCALDFASFFKGQKQPLRVEGAIDYLVQFDSTFQAAKDSLRTEITAASLPPSDRQTLLRDFETKLAAIDTQFAENPELISPLLTYDVPQPNSSTGVQSATKLSVKFNSDVIDELRKDPHSASRFLRSMVKGYVGAHGGDGILRITDQQQ